MTFLELFTQHKLIVRIMNQSIQLELDEKQKKDIDLTQDSFDPQKGISMGKNTNNIFANGFAQKIKNELNLLSGDPWYLRRRHDIKAYIPNTTIKSDVIHWLDFFQFLGGAKVTIYFRDATVQDKEENGEPTWITRTNFNNIVWPGTSFNKKIKLS
ncbi:MAG: hypothetical protein EOP48_21965 [Sphingobacteriales bacterium]|nr:MAG: hypothetical protein EOP48_21965 [Sphingobacteriales bacterium]